MAIGERSNRMDGFTFEGNAYIAGGYATSGMVFETWMPEPEIRRRTVFVYQVLAINRETEEMIGDPQIVMGGRESEAMLNFDMTSEMRKLKKKDKLAIITNSLGDFEKYEVQEVRIAAAEDE